MSRRVVIAVLAFLVATAGLVHAPRASGEGANVISNGNCAVTWNGNLYQGTNFTAVRTKKGQVNASCHAVLTSGVPVESTAQINFKAMTPYGPVFCKGILTPSGVANFSCKG